MVTAAAAITNLCIELKIREPDYPVKYRAMIHEIFLAQIDLRTLIEKRELAPFPSSRENVETKLRKSVASIATVLAEFDRKASVVAPAVARLDTIAGAVDFARHVDVGVLTVIPTELAAVRRAFGVGTKFKIHNEIWHDILGFQPPVGV